MTLADIRTQIDQVDSSIKELFIARMGLSEQVARVKAQTQDSINKPEREAAIVQNQSADMDPHLVMEYQAFIKRLMQVSRKYQYGLTLQLRDCFPFAFETEPVSMEKIAMIREELSFCDFCSKDQVRTVRSYAELAQLLASGQVDAGAGVIEHIGRGVSDPLNTLLYQQRYYINSCKVVADDDGAEKHKVVAFTRHLTVLPEHNRLKLVTVARNESGALGSILSMIADYGVNLTEIHSIPFKTGEDWNYRFFLELSLNLLEETSQALVFQLSEETQALQLLGSYRCEGDFVD